MKSFILSIVFSVFAWSAAFAGGVGHTEFALLPYFKIQNALASDDLASAKRAASSLAESGQACSANGGSCCEGVGADAAAIVESADIASARIAFKELSDKLIAVIEEDGLVHGQVYKMYCPMAFDNTGAAWIQDNENLLNPYYGASMLRCGMQQAAIGKPVEGQNDQAEDPHAGHGH